MKTRNPQNNGEILLPAAQRQRWQPIRGGLLNIYRYDYQEFRYEDGRLLLRGNNGTGKSRVLALQLPFLLDGEIVPQRVEPDGDPAKRMEWNLLFGGKYDDRLGYTWLEFGRLTEQGEAEYKTLGCALRAVQGRGIAQQWFFLTNQRIGRDLFLVNEAGQPLSKTKLEAAMGSHGKIFGSGKIEDDRREYRNAVNQSLFNLGDRYEALLNLLIQLRQPQLSRKLDEDRLSNALSQALPPLPDAVLGDVAEAFRSLETDRTELENFKAAVSRFLAACVLQRAQNSCRSTSGGWSDFDIADDESWIGILGARRCYPGNQSDSDECKQARYRHFDFPRLVQKRFTSRTSPVYRHSHGHTDP